MFNNIPDEEWVKEHGSRRLRDAWQAGCLNDCFASYIAERVSLEMPGWKWGGFVGGGFNMPSSMTEPSHDLIHHLIHLQEAYPGRSIYLTCQSAATEGKPSFVASFPPHGYAVKAAT